jgi:hypothetical protein
MISFDYPEDEMKARKAINAEQMYETLEWIKDRIEEGYRDDDVPDSVLMSVMDKVSWSLKVTGESDG